MLRVLLQELGSNNSSLRLTEEEIQWLKINKNRTFTVGLTPIYGFECFKHNDEEKGYMELLLRNISENLGIKINLKESDSWSEVYSGLQMGKVGILYRANETPEK